VLLLTLSGIALSFVLVNIQERHVRDAAEAAPESGAERMDTAAPDNESSHSRRMEILMTHAIEPRTRREYQFAECIMRGMTRSEIAQALVIKPESVGKYRNRIYSKFGIHKRQELFSLAETLDRAMPEEE
jgi:DNA-binding CsgD family transcriptional regulator